MTRARAPPVAAPIRGEHQLAALASAHALTRRSRRGGLEPRAALRVRRDVGGVGKIIDVRRFVLDARLAGPAEHALLERAGLVGSMVPLELTISVGASGSAKVAEAVEAIVGEPGFPHRAVRTALLAGAHTPLDVPAFRRMPAVQSQTA